MLNGISVSFLHQDFEDNIHRKNQNIEIANNHLMGDKWGIIKSPYGYWILTRFCYSIN